MNRQQRRAMLSRGQPILSVIEWRSRYGDRLLGVRIQTGSTMAEYFFESSQSARDVADQLLGGADYIDGKEDELPANRLPTKDVEP